MFLDLNFKINRVISRREREREGEVRVIKQVLKLYRTYKFAHNSERLGRKGFLYS